MRSLVQGISHDGRGVGRIEGKAVFIPGALPGETVDIEVLEDKKSFARGRLLSVITAHPERTAPPCPYYGICGGCDYQHASYDLQLNLKTRVVEQTLARIAGLNISVQTCLASPKDWRYRNKVTWHAKLGQGRPHMGYYLNQSRELLPVDDCLLISETMQALSNRVADLISSKAPDRDTLEIRVRESSASGELMLVIVGMTRESAEELKEVLDIYNSFILVDERGVNHTLQGHSRLEERIDSLQFKISPLTFFQVNGGQTERMVGIIRKALNLEGGEQILDAYCGAGSLALGIAGQARKVVGVEAYPAAVEDAKYNARLNGLNNCRFICGPSEQILPTLSQRFDAVILDPPRSGCHPDVISAVNRLKIPQIVYVSCEPSTLARDLKRFMEVGYKVKSVQPLDMFPQTRHVETVVRLDKNTSGR